MADAKAKKKEKTEKKPKVVRKTTEFKTMKFKDFTISAKRSGRFLVTASNGKSVNGVEKAKILVEAKLVQASFAKKEVAAPAADAPTT